MRDGVAWMGRKIERVVLKSLGVMCTVTGEREAGRGK